MPKIVWNNLGPLTISISINHIKGLVFQSTQLYGQATRAISTG